MLHKLLSRAWHKSPAENLRFLGTKLLPAEKHDRNDMLDDLLSLQSLPRILAWTLKSLPEKDILLLGYRGESLPQIPGKNLSIQAWSFGGPLPANPGALVICAVPRTDSEWTTLKNLRAEQVYSIGEILAPFSQITFLMGSGINYFFRTPDEIMPYYLGEDFFGPLQTLDSLFPLRNRRVIEFGPFDGCQTVGLTHLGADVTTIEARAENVIKTRAAFSALDLKVQIRMDDFHNVRGDRYGRFDLAFAHGVYYHSVAPFIFLENLISLSDNIFLGGFCATDTLPANAWQRLDHDGRSYRVKVYEETTGFTAGVNNIAYFFEAADLMRFFSERGYNVQVISDEVQTITAGKFLRFLATRPG